MRHVGPTTETMRTLWAWWLLLAPALAAAATVTYEYDEAGRLKRATFDGTTQITYLLDAAGNRTALTTTAPSGALQFTSGSFSQRSWIGSHAVRSGCMFRPRLQLPRFIQHG